MSIFNVNFSQIWQTFTPPVLRKPIQLAWGETLLKPVQYMRDLIFVDYADGSVYNDYSPLSSYTPSDRVIYTDRGVYENHNSSVGFAPTDTAYWNKINDNYIGIRERVRYNSQKKLFEYSLNRWFQCTGIYIENTPIQASFFTMGQTGTYSSTMSNGASNQFYMGNSYSANSTSSYTIWVPLTAYTGMSTVLTERENIVRSFADNYNLAGMFYSVSGY